jgi:hypothetical protein
MGSALKMGEAQSPRFIFALHQIPVRGEMLCVFIGIRDAMLWRGAMAPGPWMVVQDLAF